MIAIISFLTIKPDDSTIGEDDEYLNFEAINETSTWEYADSNSTAILDSGEPINWCNVGRGILVSMAQVYAVNDVVASSIMNLAVFLASPLLFIMSAIGAVVGSLGGILLLDRADYGEVYDGVWGYNGVIAMASVSCVFFAFNSMSFLVGLVNLVGTIGVQYGLRANMTLQVNARAIVVMYCRDKTTCS